MLEFKQTSRAVLCPDSKDIETVRGICITCRGVISRSCKHCNRPVPMDRCAKSLDGRETESCGPEETVEKCSSHNGKSVEYYCSDHSVVGCTACMTIDHRSCAVDYIPSIAQEINGYDGYRRLDKALRDLGNKYEAVKKKSSDNAQKAENDFRRSLVGIRQLRKNVNTYFDKLESQLVKVLLKVKDDELRKLMSVSNKCVSVSAEVNAATSELEFKRQFGQQDQFFIAMKRGEAALKRLQKELEQVESESKVNRYKYERSSEISQALRNVTSLGDIVPMKDPEDIRAELYGDASVCVGTENRYCSVTGILQLQNGYLVIADHNSKSLKVLNLEESKVVQSISTSSKPWDLTQVSNGLIAATLPREQKIIFLSIPTNDNEDEKKSDEASAIPSQYLAVQSELLVNGHCKGITKYGDRLIVTYTNPGKVEILEMNGRVLRRIGEACTRETRLVTPEYVALSPDQATVYVSDKCAGKVLCYGIEGKLRGVYKDGDWTPGGTGVDQDGTVFVCDTSGGDIHMLTPEGSKIRTLLARRNSLVSPKCIAYSQEDSKIFVGTTNKGVVKTFSIR